MFDRCLLNVLTAQYWSLLGRKYCRDQVDNFHMMMLFLQEVI